MLEESEIEIRAFLEDIKTHLPEVFIAMEACLEDWDGFAPTKMFNEFCELSNKAMREMDENTLLKHLNYMSRKLKTANKTEYEYIDVYYVESLMWNVNSKESKWAWQLFPENLKDLSLYMTKKNNSLKMWQNNEFLRNRKLCHTSTS